ALGMILVGSIRLRPPANAQNKPITVYVARWSASGRGSVPILLKVMGPKYGIGYQVSAIGRPIPGTRYQISDMQVTRTYLELKTAGQFRASFGDFPDVTITHVRSPLPALYRLCYRTVGEAFHWRDRWDWTDQEIAAHLADPAIQLFVATRKTGENAASLAGWYELRRVAEDDSVEIAYFGIVAGEFGRDRKSTRLNSSHVAISYAVFCLKKKKKTRTEATTKGVSMT